MRPNAAAWDLESGQTIRTLEGHPGWVMAVAVTPDGRRAVSGSGDQRCGSGTWRTAKRSVRSKAIRLGQGRRDDPRRPPRALGLGGPNAAAWDLESGQTIRTLEGHTCWVSAVAITPDGRRAVSGSEDRTLRLWDLESGKEIATSAEESRMF